MLDIKNNHDQKSFKTSLGNIISQNILIFETVTVFVSFVGYVLRNWLGHGFSVLMVMGISILAMAYFFRSFSSVSAEDGDSGTQAGGMSVFLFKLFNLSASVGSVGLLFRLMHWPQSEIMLLTALSGMAVTFAAYVYFRVRSRNDLLIRNELIRLIILAIFFFLVQVN